MVIFMATPVIMPRQGQSVESCLIGKWYKGKGDKVLAGDILFTYETDKATFEEASKVDGIMLDIFFEEGDDVPCLVNVCVIGAEGESVEEFRVQNVESRASQPDSDSTSPASAASDTLSARPDTLFNSLVPVRSDTLSARPDNIARNDERTVFISPRARRLAERTHADLRYAVPTGANGRIIERDVQAVLSQGHRSMDSHDVLNRPSASSASDFEIVALSNVRKFIAKAMHASLAGSAQLTSHSSFDATDIFDFRSKLKAVSSPEPFSGSLSKITVTDIIVYAVSRVLLKHKYINAHFLGDKMAVFNNAHIGLAVDTPRGLLVPTIFNANKMSLSEISMHAKDLIEKCKQGSIEPDLLKGASFTISNLGGLGVEMFTPILNPPQTGILGVCNTIERTRGGKPYPALGLSVTYDHQAMDGADSARFLKDLVEYLESFSLNLALDGGNV
jgi:pyruvate dehydrogenase E2 component (dihydrolipoamide acetyltransferase)